MLTPAVLEQLKAFPKLVHLDACMARADDDLLAALKGLPELRWLHLRGLSGWDRVTERGWEGITARRLGSLGLYGIDGIDRRFAQKLAAIPTLAALTVTGAVRDDTLVELAGLSQLQTLRLTDNPITDDGLAHLMKMTNLTHLNLKGTKVTGAGVKKLAAALPKCQILWDGGVIEPKKK